MHIIFSNPHNDPDRQKVGAYLVGHVCEEIKAQREELTRLSQGLPLLLPTIGRCLLNAHVECVHVGAGTSGTGRGSSVVIEGAEN